MIQLSSNVTTLLNSGTLSYFFLLKLKDMYITSAPFDITMSNGITYLASGGLVSVTPPKYASTVDRASYKIYLADVDFSLKSYLESGATGDLMSVSVGYFNTTGGALGDIPFGEPLLSMADTVLVYEGIVDSANYTIDLQEGKLTCVIEGGGPMADLDMVRPFQTDNNSMHQVDPTDTSFNYVFNDNAEVSLKWGKE
jgi:hypothetical protein